LQYKILTKSGHAFEFCSEKRADIETYLVLEIHRRQICFIITRHNLLERRLKRNGFFHPQTIDKRETRSTCRSTVFENDGDEVRGEGVELIGGVGLEEVKKLLLCGAIRAGSDDS